LNNNIEKVSECNYNTGETVCPEKYRDMKPQIRFRFAKDRGKAASADLSVWQQY